jgi:hypothetical protein
MGSRARHFAFSALTVALLACGGASQTDLFAGSSGSADGGTSTDGSVTTPEGGVALDGSTGKDAGGRDGGPADARADRVEPGAVIQCASATCAVGSQVCCRSNPANPTYACVSSAGCQAPGQMPIPCDDSKDCAALGQPGDVCCAETDQVTGRATQVSCGSAGSCQLQNGRAILCDPNDPTSCPQPLQCKASQSTLPGYYLCLN